MPDTPLITCERKIKAPWAHIDLRCPNPNVVKEYGDVTIDRIRVLACTPTIDTSMCERQIPRAIC
jgi:hypothetical protein